jgi:hypothetical protein
VCVDRVGLEVVGEGSDKQLVEYAALVEIKIILDFIESPRCEVAGMVVDCVVAISASETDGI